MNQTKSFLLETLSNPWVAIACLSGVMLLVYPAFAAYGYSSRGMPGIYAATAAGLVCWLGATSALVMTSLFRGTPAAIHGILLSMAFRMGLPLAAGMLLSQRGGMLAEGGVFGMIVVYYLVGLVVETLLSLSVTNAGNGISKAS